MIKSTTSSTNTSSIDLLALPLTPPEAKEDLSLSPKRLKSIIASRSPFTPSPQTYAYKAADILDTHTITNGTISYKITPLRLKDGSFAQGQFSRVYIPCPDQPPLCSEESNDNIVVKILKPDRLFKATSMMTQSLSQYNSLRTYFEGESTPPIIQLYNEDTAKISGYTLIRKASPVFERAPWDKDIKIPDLSPAQHDYLKDISKLLRASNALKEAGESPLDLKWNNLGLVDGKLKLFDYVNIPFVFNYSTDSYAKRLSNDNPHIHKELSKHENSIALNRRNST